MQKKKKREGNQRGNKQASGSGNGGRKEPHMKILQITLLCVNLRTWTMLSHQNLWKLHMYCSTTRRTKRNDQKVSKLSLFPAHAKRAPTTKMKGEKKEKKSLR